MRLPSTARFDTLAAAFSYVSGIPKEDILSKCKRRDLSDARAMISQLMRWEGYSLHQIADAIGRDHSTISHYAVVFPYITACKKSRRLYAEFVRAVEEYDSGSPLQLGAI